METVAKGLPPVLPALFSVFAGPVIAMLLSSCLVHRERTHVLETLRQHISLDLLSAACAAAVADVLSEGRLRRGDVALVFQLLGAIGVGYKQVEESITAARGLIAQVCLFWRLFSN
jgi:L-aminopeptidase/D-esterase-like protein